LSSRPSYCHPERVAERSESSNPMPAGGRHTMIFAEGAAEGSASPHFCPCPVFHRRGGDPPPGHFSVKNAMPQA